MTKRILAIVLALAMSLSLMTAISFAAVPDIGNIIITKNQDGKTMTVTWNSITDTEYYTVQVYRDGDPLGNPIRATSATAQITPNGAGNYSVAIVELPDGKVVKVNPSDLEFLDTDLYLNDKISKEEIMKIYYDTYTKKIKN